MTSEMFWLTSTLAFSAILFVPYAYERISRIGLRRLLADPLPGDDPFEVKWAHRAYRAHMNAIENIVIFAPLALTVQVLGANNEITARACEVYFFARLLHAPIYIMNVPYLRFMTYMVGLVSCLVLAWQLLTW